ncbi:hypothetical protein [Persicirhabdus sediminis]|uniref:Spermine/spermidine synthase n=1 Tax=Persicirhabdus sediminis TaxID=454144 RepID=A0A8J7MC92_9BACT|nr:hypothetical protein [Persicirhabdus sediminis]MBK1790433.1 hypothetical protein [Persicirhabdus sediminis]
MKPYNKIAETQTPEGNPLELIEHDGTYMICSNGEQLMTSYSHGSEEELARLGCAPFRPATQPVVLIGGLGMGYTLSAAKESLPQKKATFIVSEFTEAIVEWNKTHLAPLHDGKLLDDERVVIKLGPVQKVMRQASDKFNVILMDVDNGPGAFHGKKNDSIYTLNGLRDAWNALKQGGVYAVWSARPDKEFTKRLEKVGFNVNCVSVDAAHKGNKRRQHTIWLATKGSYVSQNKPQQRRRR